MRHDFDRFNERGDRGREGSRNWAHRDENLREEFENRYRRSPGHTQAWNDEGRYRQQDYHMEQDYYDSVGNRRQLENVRQGYGFPGFGRSSEDENYMDEMKRERESRQRQGYGSGRLGGYSGSAFGGANYSAHGDFGGAPHYGSMSGYGGNADDYVSSSGYGGGYGGRDRYAAGSESGMNSRHRGARYGNHNFGDGSHSDEDFDRTGQGHYNRRR